MNEENIIENKNNSITLLNNYLDDCIKDLNKCKKANLISYWIKDYTKYLDIEDKYKNITFKKYKRGDIIKANLGFNIGNEHGGLHYCIVLNKNDSIYGKILNVIPLTSKKDNKSVHPLNVDLGNELYEKIENTLNYLVNMPITETQGPSLYTVGKLLDEISSIKSGSIALVNQITTISKIRIYDPKSKFDVLHNIRLSFENLDAIDTKIRELFIK